jgi:hypothetical protein
MIKQTTFASANFDAKKWQMQKEKFLAQTDKVAPWTALEALICIWTSRANCSEHP